MHVTEFHSFLRLNNIPRVYIPHLVYPFICQWTLVNCLRLQANMNMGIQMSLSDSSLSSF